MSKEEAREIDSMRKALQAIKEMQVLEHTNKAEVLALCISIANLELEKWKE